MARPTDPNRPAFELEILRQAARVFSEVGYRNSTTEDIAKRVNLKKSSLYHYFKSKESILFHALSLNLKKSLEPLLALEQDEGPAVERLRSAIRCQVQEMIDAPYIANLFLTDKGSLTTRQLKQCLTLRDRHEQILRKIIDQGIADGSIGPIDSSVAVKIIYGSLNGLPSWWKPNGRLDAARISTVFSDMLVDRMLSA
ncbi:MAG: TetR/AcrR family transcriptional regulator [Sulfuricaulis sp.]|nr:TetR/AcrR family transcriptional regulator [Sulfuricaulis sp.]